MQQQFTDNLDKDIEDFLASAKYSLNNNVDVELCKMAIDSYYS